jgi:tetratricopeptide (TPR) repeat protein
MALGQATLAAASFRRAIRLQPDYVGAHFNLGNMLVELGQTEAAISSYDQALALAPNQEGIWYSRACALHTLRRHAEAVASYNQVIALQPDHSRAYNNRGVALRDLGQDALAVESFERAIALRPGDPQPLNNLGLALKHLRQYRAAIDCHDRGLAIDPGYAIGWYNRGLALREIGDPAAALASHDRAIAINPQAGEFHCDRGLALQDLGQMDAAIASFDTCIGLLPDYPDAHWNKSLALLATGDFGRGWPLYEWRWRNAKTGLRPAHFAQPLWLGEAPLVGKSILLHCEQGLGDAIQFFRYAALVRALGAHVCIVAPTALFELFKAAANDVEVIRTGSDLSGFDYHCPLLSLPLALKTTLATIPHQQSYLRSDPTKVALWSERLGPARRPRIGLVWRGNASHNHDHFRSVPLAALLPYLPEGVDYVSLQKELRDGDQETLNANPGLKHFGALIQDFSDTAALCQLMDQVISVDTSVAHLSGALGRPTHVLLPPSPDWRWLQNRADSPWYASVTLHRQARGQGWEPTLRQLGARLSITP